MSQTCNGAIGAQPYIYVQLRCSEMPNQDTYRPRMPKCTQMCNSFMCCACTGCPDVLRHATRSCVVSAQDAQTCNGVTRAQPIIHMHLRCTWMPSQDTYRHAGAQLCPNAQFHRVLWMSMMPRPSITAETTARESGRKQHPRMQGR